MQIPQVSFFSPVVLLWVGVMAAHAFARLRESKFKEFFGSMLVGLLPAFLSALYLTRDEGLDMISRIWVMGGLGGLVGVFAGAWLAYITSNQEAAAQQPIAAKPEQSFSQLGGQAQDSSKDSEHIYQAGIEVGRVFGGRRLPNDATAFEFKEITNCAQFNPRFVFIFNGVKLRFISEQNSVMMVFGRSDNPIRFGVLARVVD